MTARQLSPIFVMGPARGGTTITYQLVVEAFDANYVDAFAASTMDPDDISGWVDTPAKRAAFNAKLATMGITDRGVDSWRVDDRVPEEFTMISGAGVLNARGGVSREMVEDLVAVLGREGRPDRPVVLKDPRSVAYTERLCEWFPSSGFVFVRRDAAQILASQVNAIHRVLREDSDYTRMLMRQGLMSPMTFGSWWLRVAGEDRVRRRLTGVLSHLLERQLREALAAHDAVPHDRRVVLDHRAMSADPRATLAALDQLGEARLPDDLESRVREPRDAEPPIVEAARARVSESVWRRWHGDWAEPTA